MTRLDEVRVAGADLLFRPVVVGDAHRARLQNADVPQLTALASHDRLDALRPAPSWLQHHARRARSTQPDDLDLRLLGRPRLIRRIETPSFHTGHRTLPSFAAITSGRS